MKGSFLTIFTDEREFRITRLIIPHSIGFLHPCTIFPSIAVTWFTFVPIAELFIDIFFLLVDPFPSSFFVCV